MVSLRILIANIYFLHFLIGHCIIIDTELGQIEGIQDEFGTYVFHNIPYAEPPVDELRWKPTEPLREKWNGVYNATAPGYACYQPFTGMEMMMFGSNGNMSEDCLILAIQTPYDFDQPETQSLRSVLFWIHGGAFTSGTGQSYVYTELSKNQDIVIVSINYRLGVAGFLLDPELQDSARGNGGANAFLDQIEALKWVKSNIESFGGDPNEITVAGESAGGISVCALLVSPLARGLFKRSIQMSGSCYQSLGAPQSIDEGWKIAKDVRDAAGAKTFDDLRKMEMRDIMDAFTPLMKALYPTIDGYVFPLDTTEIMNSGVVNGESAMIGTLFRESFTEKPFYFGVSPQNLTELNDYYYAKLFDSQAKLFQQYYPETEIKTKIWPYGVSEFDDNVASLIQTVQSTDCWVRCGSLQQADILATHPLTRDSFEVFFYQYGFISKPWDQVSHGYDMVALFAWDMKNATFDSTGGVGQNQEFEKITQKFFGDYIKSGMVPMKDGTIGSIQNGYYLQIVDEAKLVPANDLDVVRNRCQVYEILGEEFYGHSFCTGIFVEDFNFEDWMQTESNETVSDHNTNHTAEAKEEL